MSKRPVIGITLDNLENSRGSGKYEVGVGYSDAVAEAGGVGVLLPHQADAVSDYLALCDGFIFTGGVDPDTRPFGAPVHPKARVMDEARQAFEVALLRAATDAFPQPPCLGVCLGMQLMSLIAGGRLDQYMPESMNAEAAGKHYGKQVHEVEVVEAVPGAGWPKLGLCGPVVSHHQQAVADAGSLAIVARSPDGVVEAVAQPGARFYVGVQWHPERGGADVLNRGLISALVRAARG